MGDRLRRCSKLVFCRKTEIQGWLRLACVAWDMLPQTPLLPSSLCSESLFPLGSEHLALGNCLQHQSKT